MLTALLASFLREVRFLRHHPWDLSLVSWIPLLVIVVMPWLFGGSVARHLPVAVVDNDQSAMSRELIRLIEASPTSLLAMRSNSLSEAQAAIRTGDVLAIIYVPTGAQKRALRGEQAKVYVFYNNAYYTPGNLIAHDISSIISKLNADFHPSSRAAANRVVNKVSPYGAPVAVQVTVLFNSSGSYEWGLVTAILPGLLHLLLCCAVVIAQVRETSPEQRASWLADAGGSLLWAIIYKALFYTLIFTVFGVFSLVWLHGRGWPVNGSVLLLVFAQAVMYFAYCLMMAFVVAIYHRQPLGALSLASMLTSPALTYGNILFPVNGASLFVKIISAIYPYTWYMQLQTQQMQGFSTWWDSMPYLLYLGGFLVVLLPLSWLTTRRLLAHDTATAEDAT